MPRIINKKHDTQFYTMRTERS